MDKTRVIRMKKYLLVFICLLTFISYFLNAQAVSIIYFNDAHEIAPVIDDLGERGGVARLKTIVDSVKKDNPNTIVVFGGDCAGGTLFGALYHGLPQIKAFNKIPVDLASFGQHDFDFGVENNLRLITNSQFEWITSNLVYDDGSSYAGLERYKILSLAGIKIGFLGLTDAMETTRNAEDVCQLDLINAAEQVLELIEKDNPDVIIAITQTNFVTNKDLLEKFPKINAILTEELSETITEISYIGDRPIISPCGNIGSVARLDINRESGSFSSFVTAYPIDASVKSDSDMHVFEKKYQQELEEKLKEELSYLKSPLIAGITTDHASRWKETNIGNLLTDSYREYFGADIAILNGGGIRSDAEEGSFSTKDALAIIPFGNCICMIELSGEDFLTLLEHGASAVEEKAGRFLQISGAKYSYNPNRDPYERILQVEVGNEPLDVNRVYSVALPDYILRGGDGFKFEKDIKVLVSENAAPKDIEVLIKYLKDRENIQPSLERRITVAEGKD